MKQLLFICLLVFSVSATAQYTVSGIVTDTITGSPLAFVNIVVKNSTYGTTTDIDGKFSFRSTTPINRLVFTYVGYKPKEVFVEKANIKVELKKKQVNLKEVVVLPGENPAHRIIKRAVKNKAMHHPKKINAYKCNSYNKIIYTANKNKVVENANKGEKVDSSALKMADYLESHYLLMLESYTEKAHLAPFKEKETILSSRVSGLKKPSFTILSTDVQPFSFYDDYITLLDKEYLNPISKGSENKYLFILEDTVFQKKDTVYVISFTQKKNRNFDALTGVVYINTNGYAIQNVIAEPYHASLNKAKVQQKYSLVKNKQWFPSQLNFNWEIAEYGLQVTGKSYLSNVELSPIFPKNYFNEVNVELSDTATKNAEKNIANIRPEPLTQKELNTYQYIDSVGEAKNLDKKVYVFESLISGEIPLSIFSVKIKSLYTYNDFEGHRPGLRVETNDKLFKWATIGGYGAWGSRDVRWKYGGDLLLNFHKKKDISIKLGYKNDVEEPGNITFISREPTLLNSRARQLLTSRMVLNKEYSGAFSFRVLRYFLMEWGLTNTEQSILTPYRFLAANTENVQVALSRMRLTEASIKLRFAYRERFADLFGEKVSLGTNFPIVWFNYEKGLKGFLNGFFNYERFAAKATESFRLRRLGESNITLEAGLLNGTAPASRNFYGKASFSESIFLQVDQTFQTMRLYEFLSNKFIHIFFSQNLGSIHFKTDRVKPEFVLVHSMGWGDIRSKEQHAFISFKSMEKGYYESGLLVKNIFRLNYLDVAWLGFGVGAYYRYGPYRLPGTMENLAIKASLGFGL